MLPETKTVGCNTKRLEDSGLLSALKILLPVFVLNAIRHRILSYTYINVYKEIFVPIYWCTVSAPSSYSVSIHCLFYIW